MALSFPGSPSNGQTYTYNGVTYEFDGKRWKSQALAADLSSFVTSSDLASYATTSYVDALPTGGGSSFKEYDTTLSITLAGGGSYVWSPSLPANAWVSLSVFLSSMDADETDHYNLHIGPSVFQGSTWGGTNPGSNIPYGYAVMTHLGDNQAVNVGHYGVWDEVIAKTDSLGRLHFGLAGSNGGTGVTVRTKGYWTADVGTSSRVDFLRGTITATSANTIKTNDSGTVLLSAQEHSDNSWYTFNGSNTLVVNRSGILTIDLNQDIITQSSTGYTTLGIYKNGAAVHRQLMQHTGGQWDCLVTSHYTNVVNGDVIDITISGGSADLTGLDSGTWSYYNFLLVS